MVVGKGGETLTIRVPKGMSAQLSAVAKQNGRSRNSEIVVRLSAFLRRHRRSK